MASPPSPKWHPIATSPPEPASITSTPKQPQITRPFSISSQSLHWPTLSQLTHIVDSGTHIPAAQSAFPVKRAYSGLQMASDGPTLDRSGEMRERASVEEQPRHEATGLHRTAEIHETESGNVELRKDPGHTTKPLASVNPEHILDPRGVSVATKPEDILEVRRGETDTHLE